MEPPAHARGRGRQGLVTETCSDAKTCLYPSGLSRSFSRLGAGRCHCLYRCHGHQRQRYAATPHQRPNREWPHCRVFGQSLGLNALTRCYGDPDILASLNDLSKITREQRPIASASVTGYPSTPSCSSIWRAPTPLARLSRGDADNIGTHRPGHYCLDLSES